MFKLCVLSLLAFALPVSIVSAGAIAPAPQRRVAPQTPAGPATPEATDHISQILSAMGNDARVHADGVARLRAIGRQAAPRLLAYIDGVIVYWSTEKYREEYALLVALRGAIPRLNAVQETIVALTWLLVEWRDERVIPLIGRTLSLNEPIRVHAGESMRRALAELQKR
jgi:hypothetical protein